MCNCGISYVSVMCNSNTNIFRFVMLPCFVLFSENADGKYISPFHDIPLFAGSKEVCIYAFKHN